MVMHTRRLAMGIASYVPGALRLANVRTGDTDSARYCYAVWMRHLCPGGLMSHQIDFTSHETARVWNGHWTFSDREWRLIRGRRSWFLNRQPLNPFCS